MGEALWARGRAPSPDIQATLSRTSMLVLAKEAAAGRSARAFLRWIIETAEVGTRADGALMISVPMDPRDFDDLAAFESDLEDLEEDDWGSEDDAGEDEPDREANGDEEPSLASSQELNQSAWGAGDTSNPDLEGQHEGREPEDWFLSSRRPQS